MLLSSQCRVAALRFLKIRPRSVFELCEKLAGKGYAHQVIDEVIESLQSIDLLNDRAFTASWIRCRLTRPFGFGRIISELKAKGIAEETIKDAVAQAKCEYKETDVVSQLAASRATRMLYIDGPKRQKRIFDFLVRRGFSTDVVMKVVKKRTFNDNE